MNNIEYLQDLGAISDKALDIETNRYLDSIVNDEDDDCLDEDDLFVKLLKHRCSSGESLASEAIGNDNGTLEAVIVKLANPYLERDDVPELLDELRQAFADYFKGHPAVIKERE